MESVQARRWGDNVLGASTFIEGGGDQVCMVFTWWGGGSCAWFYKLNVPSFWGW